MAVAEFEDAVAVGGEVFVVGDVAWLGHFSEMKITQYSIFQMSRSKIWPISLLGIKKQFYKNGEFIGITRLDNLKYWVSLSHLKLSSLVIPIKFLYLWHYPWPNKPMDHILDLSIWSRASWVIYILLKMAKSRWGNTMPILTEDSFEEYFVLRYPWLSQIRHRLAVPVDVQCPSTRSDICHSPDVEIFLFHHFRSLAQKSPVLMSN